MRLVTLEDSQVARADDPSSLVSDADAVVRGGVGGEVDHGGVAVAVLFDRVERRRLDADAADARIERLHLDKDGGSRAGVTGVAGNKSDAVGAGVDWLAGCGSAVP